MVSFCAAVRSLCAYLGGMTCGSVAKTRRTMALFSGSPGAIGVAPVLDVFNASSRRSRRKPAWRARASGPWQRKQVSDMIGRMSRLKRTGSAAKTKPGKTRPAKTKAANKRRFTLIASLSFNLARKQRFQERAIEGPAAGDALVLLLKRAP